MSNMFVLGIFLLAGLYRIRTRSGTVSQQEGVLLYHVVVGELGHIPIRIVATSQ